MLRTYETEISYKKLSSTFSLNRNNVVNDNKLICVVKDNDSFIND